MHIRKVTPEEWPTLQDLNNEVFLDNAKYDPDIIEDWAHSKAGENYFHTLVNDPESVCFVAEDENGKLVGYLAASPKTFSYRKSKYLEVDNMGVNPEYRSQGVGRQLMAECQQWARQQGYERLYVNSYARNEKAIKFYESCGLNIIDVSLEADL